MDAPSQDTIMRWVQGGIVTGLFFFVRWAVRTYLWRREPDASIHKTEGEAAERFANAAKTDAERQVSLVDAAIKMAQEARAETEGLKGRYKALETRYRRTVDKVGRQERQIENLNQTVAANAETIANLERRCAECEKRLNGGLKLLDE